MKLHELSPAPGSVRTSSVRAEVTVPAMVKRRAKATKDRTPVPAAV